MARPFATCIEESKLLFDDAKTQSVQETTPSRISDEVKLFAAQLSADEPRVVPVAADQLYGLYAFCDVGVQEKVRREGGRPLFGWTIWELPDVLLTAEFHSVYVDRDGTVVDITPKPGGEQHIVFVPDRNCGTGFDFDRRPTNRRYNLVPSIDRARLADERISKMSPTQRAYEEKRANKAGSSLQESIVAKIPENHRRRIVDDFIRICDELDGESDRLRRIFGDEIEPSQRYIDLSLKKSRMLGFIKS